jgi:hypothetical protein
LRNEVAAREDKGLRDAIEKPMGFMRREILLAIAAESVEIAGSRRNHQEERESPMTIARRRVGDDRGTETMYR